MIRITGGELRGRLIHPPESSATRPTQSMLRQALFNSIQARIPGARVLDLFAGCGLLGIEALSRGAAEVDFLEVSPKAARLIERNLEELGVGNRARIHAKAVETLFDQKTPLARYDIVLADPPYKGEWAVALLERIPWSETLAEGGIFCLETSAKSSLPDSSGSLRRIRQKRYGESLLTTYALTK